MKIDPNLPVDMHSELILCEGGKIVLHDGTAAAQAELDREGGPFLRFCGALDPNRCFLVALILDDADKTVFFKAREVAGEKGIHVQAPVDTPARLRAQWDAYLRLKRTGPQERKR